MQDSGFIRIGVADDHVIVRAALRQFLGEQPDMRVVGEACDGRGAIDLARRVEMDVLLLDIAMPGQSGIDAIAMLHAKAPRLRILVFSTFPASSYAMKMIRLGACGYLNKQCESEEVVQAVRTVARGNHYITAELAHLLAAPVRSAGLAPHEALTDREFQVLIKLAQGLRSEQIGRDVSISPKTVSSYRCKIMDKLGLGSNGDLTYYALRHQLIE